MRTVAFCEIDPFCRRVLAKHWPNVPCYDDVRSLTADRLAADGIAPDVICGGFPCQDISTAGKQAGIDAARSGLWSEIVRLARDLRPRFLVVENVTNLLAGPTEQPGAWFGRVLGDLAEIGLDAEWHCIPASAVGASHRRDRVWIVAYPTDAIRREIGRGVGCGEGASGSQASNGAIREGMRDAEHGGPTARGTDVPNAESVGRGTRRPRRPSSLDPRIQDTAGSLADPDCLAPIGAAIARQERPAWCPEPALGRVVDDVSYSVVEPELRALGNAVVPQIPEIIGRAIMKSFPYAG
jgi:DNA (cytosine-5)-methyltransferase 1